MIYILVNSETGRRVRWWPDGFRHEAQATLNMWDRWNHGVYRLDTASNEDVENRYPQNEIPDAMGGCPVALMDDGGYLCEFCVGDPFNPVHRASGDEPVDGWGVVDWFNSAEAEERTMCDHCHRYLN